MAVAYQFDPVKSRSGEDAEIRLALRAEGGVTRLCVAMGHTAGGDGSFGDELIEQWLKLRRVLAGGEILVGDLSFGAVYETTP